MTRCWLQVKADREKDKGKSKKGGKKGKIAAGKQVDRRDDSAACDL